jgi:hypothetical protein
MTEGRLQEVWASRDLPVLIEVTRCKDEGQGLIEGRAVADALGMDLKDVHRAMTALGRRGLVAGQGTSATTGLEWVTEVSGSAYLVTDLHPDGDDALSRLIDGLRQAAEMTSDEDERGRLRRAADALGGIARDVGVGVLTAVITGA